MQSPQVVFGNSQFEHTKPLACQNCTADEKPQIPLSEAVHWSEQHAEFIAAYNKLLTEEGVALEEWRGFS
ncbi:MAG: hypothetical protein V4463_00900 [Pseudomonadota bacterium]